MHRMVCTSYERGPMKTVMILGGNFSEVPVVETAIDLGYKTIVVDINENAKCFDVPGVIAEQESIVNKEAVLALAKKYDIDGILASVDSGVRTVAYVAQELGLPGITEEAALMGTDKILMRQRLKEAGLPIPEFYVVNNKEEYLEAVGHFTDTCIVKANDNCGSRGIYLLKDLSNKEEIDYAYDYCVQYSGTNQLLVEEVMEGPEICAETLNSDGVCYPAQITDQLHKEPPYYTDAGYSQPSLLSDDLLQEIRQIAIDANMAIENYQGSSCTEMIITDDGPKVVELGARLASDFMATKMVPLSNGIDVPTNILKIALGEPVEITPLWQKGSCVRFFMKERVGLIKEVTGVEEALKVSGVIDLQILKGPGEMAVPLRKSPDRMAMVITQGDTAEEAISAAEEALSLVDFVVADE